MIYEVEMKFPVLGPLEFGWSEAGEEIDTYYQHPCRDFAQTDEGLRVRSCSSGSFLTYKGPKIDPVTKTRREIELPLEPGTLERYQSLLEALGFLPVEIVRKFRKTAKIVHEGREYHLCFDSLPVLKERGLTSEFLEIEALADPETLEATRQAVLRFAQTLIAQGLLGASVRKGYLEMILESNPTTPAL